MADEVKIELVPQTKTEAKADSADRKQSAKKAAITTLYQAAGMAILALAGFFADPVQAGAVLGGWIDDKEKLAIAVLLLTSVVRYTQDRFKKRDKP